MAKTSLAPILATCSLLLAVAPRAQQATRWTVTGRLVDEAGKPLAGAGIAAGYEHELLTSDALEHPLTRSADDGRFAVELVREPQTSAGPLRNLLIAHPGRESLVVSVVLLEGNPAGATVDLGVVPLFSGAELRGRVVGRDDKPLAGVRVQAHDLMLPELTLPGATFAQARPMTAALSDEQGRFALPCAPRSGASLEFSKEGWYTRDSTPVGVESALTITLEPSGFVEGRLGDPRASGLVTWLGVTYEAGATAFVMARPDGTFRVPVAQPGRLRIRNHPTKADVPNVLGAILDGPCQGVELAVQGLTSATGPAILVRALDKTTKKPITSFTASALWEIQAGGRSFQRATLAPADAEGSVRLVAPEGTTKAVIGVAARGHAPENKLVLLPPMVRDGKTTPSTEVTLELASAASITGRVVDSVTGMGVAGAAYWDTPGGLAMRYAGIPFNSPRTSDDGSFRIEGLLAGKHAVLFVHPERPIPAPLSCTLEAQQTLSDRVVKIDSGWKLSGKLAGWLGSPLSRVRVVAPAPVTPKPGADPRYLGQTGRRESRIAPDGGFELGGLESGTFDLVLQVADLTRLAGPLEYPLGSVLLGENVTKEFGTAGLTQALVFGRLELATATPIFERIAVFARACSDTKDARAQLANTQKLTGASVDPGGRFELRLAPGEWQLCVADCTSGLILHEGEPFKVIGGQRVEQPLELQLTRVRFVLVPRQEGQPIVASRLVLAMHHALGALPHGTLPLGRPGYRDGLPLAPGQREVDLWLPPGEFAFRVVSHAGYLREGSSFRELQLGTAGVKVLGAATQEVVVPVDPPPSNADIEKG